MTTIRDALNDHEKQLLKDYGSIMEFAVSEIAMDKYVKDIYKYPDLQYADGIKAELIKSFQRFEGKSVVSIVGGTPLKIKIPIPLMLLYNYQDCTTDILFDVCLDGKKIGRRFIDNLHIIEDEET